MAHTSLDAHIDQLIRKRDAVLDTTPPAFALVVIDYYDATINRLIDLLIDLE